MVYCRNQVLLPLVVQKCETRTVYNNFIYFTMKQSVGLSRVFLRISCKHQGVHKSIIYEGLTKMFPFIVVVVVVINILPNNREGETSSSNRDGQKKYSLVRPFSDNPTTGPFLCPSLVSVVHKKNIKKKYSRVYMNTQYLGLICVRHAIKIRTIIIVIKRVVIVCTYGFSGSHSSVAPNNVAKPSGFFFFFFEGYIHIMRT